MLKILSPLLKSYYMKLLAIILVTQEIPLENTILLLLTHI